MKDNIYTIPISEVFEPKCGCPICSIRDTLEQRCIEYIMGAAMMEPDVRIETNKKGFCKQHFDMMLKRKNRLSLALMLDSHLKELQEHGMKPAAAAAGGLLRKKEVEKPKQSCFVCDQIDWAEQRMLDTVLRMYAQNAEFRTLYAEQEYLCYPHFRLLSAYAETKMDRKYKSAFLKASAELCGKSLSVLSEDVSHYCSMFDYRNSGEDADWGNSRDSIERAVYFLTSRRPEEK